MNTTNPPADEITKKIKASYEDWAGNRANRQDGYPLALLPPFWWLSKVVDFHNKTLIEDALC